MRRVEIRFGRTLHVYRTKHIDFGRVAPGEYFRHWAAGIDGGDLLRRQPEVFEDSEGNTSISGA